MSEAQQITFEERYYQNQRRRHLAAARKYAQDLADGAALALRMLDAGNLPHHNLSEDAVGLAKRVEVLEALDEMHEAYNSAPEAD